MKYWYKLECHQCHQGCKSKELTIKYVFAEDISNALKKYHYIRGVKRGLHGNSMFPTITKLDDTEAGLLEKRIIREKKITLERAKRSWYSDLKL